jgi:uncharacterized pyridoxamine 5'-phosphate oxidase family protein
LCTFLNSISIQIDTIALLSAYFTINIFIAIIYIQIKKYNSLRRFIIMNEVTEFLKKNPVQYLATIGLDGKPKNRPFMFCLEKEGKLWFCTNNKKDVYAQLQKNPYVEITVSSPENKWIRLSGKAVFENNMDVKKGCMSYPLIKSLYKTADNPIFEVFYIGDAKAVINDFSGNPPKEYKL